MKYAKYAKQCVKAKRDNLESIIVLIFVAKYIWLQAKIIQYLYYSRTVKS